MSGLPEHVPFRTVSKEKPDDPLEYTEHLLRVEKTGAAFLNATLDDHRKRKRELEDIIDEFSYPVFHRRLPITVTERAPARC
jgi:hypothetical protein